MVLEPCRLKNTDTGLGVVRMAYSVKHLPCMQEEPSSHPRIRHFKIQVMLTRDCNLISGKADPTETHPWDSVAGWSDVIGKLQADERSCLCDDTRGCPLASTCMLTHEHTCAHTWTQMPTPKLWLLAFTYLPFIFYLTWYKGRNLEVYNPNWTCR